jgi:hypothetical protein
MTSVRKEKYGKINRGKVLGFTWDNKEYFGYEGDSLASALLANNINIVGRSAEARESPSYPKYSLLSQVNPRTLPLFILPYFSFLTDVMTYFL